MRRNFLTLLSSLTVLSFTAFQSFALVPPPESLRASQRHEQAKPADPDTTVTVSPKSAFYLPPNGNGFAFYLPPSGNGLAFYLPPNGNGLAFYLPPDGNALTFYLPPNGNALASYLPLLQPAQA